MAYFVSYIRALILNKITIAIHKYITKRLTHLSLVRNPNSFYRYYGGTDTKSFFAFAVIPFFEHLREIFSNNHKLYNHMCLLLNQNSLTPIDELA